MIGCFVMYDVRGQACEDFVCMQIIPAVQLMWPLCWQGLPAHLAVQWALQTSAITDRQCLEADKFQPHILLDFTRVGILLTHLPRRNPQKPDHL